MKNEQGNVAGGSGGGDRHELLCAYVLGEVTAAEREQVEAALAASAELRAECANLEATIGLVQGALGEPKQLSELATSELMVRAKVGLESGPGRGEELEPHPLAASRPVWTRPILQMAAAAVVLLGLSLVFILEQEQSVETARVDSEVVQRKTEQQPATRLPATRLTDSPVESIAPLENETALFAQPSANEVARDSSMSKANWVVPQRTITNELETTVSILDLNGFGAGAVSPNLSENVNAPSSSGQESMEVHYGAGLAGSKKSRSVGLIRMQGVANRRTESEIPNEQANALSASDSERVDSPKIEGSARDERGVLDADALISSCWRREQESPSAMFFRYWGDNPFEYPLADPLSTFSVDVDTASYALARKYLRSGVLPPKAAVRTEEFVNYFKADVESPFEGDFGITTDLAPSLFGGQDQQRWMLRVVVRAREVSKEQRAPLSLSFVVDTSGSMQQGQRMELVKHALRLLVAELDANDSIAVVGFSNEARLVLPMTSVANRSAIETAINGLQPQGGTNAEAGLKLGYAQAVAALREDASNRVVFLSDGVANVGVVDQERIASDVRSYRERGIYLNTIGVGMGNHNDTFLEQLANKGDGICNYFDDAQEARRAIVENFTGAFETVARDVKIQVEFDPAQVMSYRLLGYENRAIADKNFRNDAVDAGEVGAGHQVTALYELVCNPSASDSENLLATVRLRWKQPYKPSLGNEQAAVAESVTEIAHAVRARSAAGSFAATSAGYRRAVLVAQFAEFLRRSRHAKDDSVEQLIAQAKLLAGELRDEEFDEFVELVVSSQDRIRAWQTSINDLDRALDDLREHCILKAQFEDQLAADGSALSDQQIEMRSRLDREIKALEDDLRELAH